MTVGSQRKTGRTRMYLIAGCGVITLVALNRIVPSPSDSTAPPLADRPAAAGQPPGKPPARPAYMDYHNNPKLAAERVELLAKRSGGDFRRLSAEDQKLLDSMTAGYGAEMLRTKAKELKSKAAPAQKKP